KHPVLCRATEQWFCSVDDSKEKTFESIHGVAWLPEWGEDRITGMVRDRSDWCISRQRLWGVPIPIFYCKECGKELITRESINAVAALFRKEGSNAWYRHDANEILPEGTTCACGCHSFTKEKDVMDVWFDSGVTHAAVLATRPDLHWPADIYLEGNDQYRGWFQSSLLTSIAWKGVAPYKMVITHGMVVDGDGRKMSKSLGNGIVPGDIVKKYGADILRLWVASSDYQGDVRISEGILKQLSEVYRKIRNTARYILGNISDFDVEKDAVPFDELQPIDKWALWRLDDLQKNVYAAYERYEFHTIFHAVHNFCVVDMSNFYLDVLKDRLYVEKADSIGRRAAQTVIHHILDSLTRLMAPILVFTAEEIWRYLPHKEEESSVMYAGMPALSEQTFDGEFVTRWERLHTIRDDVKKALEIARAAHEIGGSLDAEVTLYANGELGEFLNTVKEDLPTVLIVSYVHLETEGEGSFHGDVEGLSITVSHAHGEKCARCWTYDDTVGKSADHPTLCDRCAEIIK
ncbi:MAG TPA: isoleucine--tRNA ligase, partial [Ruminococcaceae bacterium]|nr:isoleucine--tRNA ligase [Oscillospiraceae bacterium]